MTTELRRRWKPLALLAGLALSAGSLAAHDLFLKLDSYFLPKNTAVRVPVLNGTFSKSENSIARDRIAALTLSGPAGSSALDTAALTARNDTSFINLRTGDEGTYVLGLSTRPRELALTGEQFNGYLKEEGLDDVLAERTRSGTLAEPAKERYAKHVKAVFQVGATRSDAWERPLGYPAEIIPLVNPYALRRGGTLQIRCLLEGQPGAELTVLAGGRTRTGGRLPQLRVRTDAEGRASIPLATAGKWYVKFIRMQRSSEPGITHESQWATLTFEVR
jgi:hypothetical protein